MILFLPESQWQPVVVDSKSDVEEGVVKALNGRRFLSLRWLDEVDCKNDKYQCFVTDDLANDPPGWPEKSRFFCGCLWCFWPSAFVSVLCWRIPFARSSLLGIPPIDTCSGSVPQVRRLLVWCSLPCWGVESLCEFWKQIGVRKGCWNIGCSLSQVGRLFVWLPCFPLVPTPGHDIPRSFWGSRRWGQRVSWNWRE